MNYAGLVALLSLSVSTHRAVASLYTDPNDLAIGAIGELQLDSATPAKGQDSQEPTRSAIVEVVPLGNGDCSAVPSITIVSNSLAADCSYVVGLVDNGNIVGRVAVEAKLLIPMPPGNDLLRPPQER
jgi:hypothetical protein